MYSFKVHNDSTFFQCKCQLPKGDEIDRFSQKGKNFLFSGGRNLKLLAKMLRRCYTCYDYHYALIYHEEALPTVFGREKNAPSADDIARWIGTINYEVTCIVGKRVARVYLKNNEVVSTHTLLDKEM